MVHFKGWIWKLILGAYLLWIKYKPVDIYLFQFEKGVLQDLTLSCDDLLVNETVRMLGNKSGFNISGIKFSGNGLGQKELCVKWRGLTDYVRLELVPGQPAKLALVGWDLSQVWTCHVCLHSEYKPVLSQFH